MVTDPSGAAVTGAAVSAKPPTGSVLQTVSEFQRTLLLRKSGATIILVFLAERFVLRRIEPAGRWLGNDAGVNLSWRLKHGDSYVADSD